MASISLKPVPGGRRVYAYLRYKDQMRTVTRYVGDASAMTREEALALGWTAAFEKGLLG
jgi:DNA mismatch endonuclease (patch repair protein)